MDKAVLAVGWTLNEPSITGRSAMAAKLIGGHVGVTELVVNHRPVRQTETISQSPVPPVEPKGVHLICFLKAARWTVDGGLF